jgi:hypothetical protein
VPERFLKLSARGSSVRHLRQKTPVLIDPGPEGATAYLPRVEMGKNGPDGYTELWLQKLIAARPQVLPIQDIEPAFTPAFAVCMELPLGPKSLDILLVTASGNLIAVECKLWRNPEARREVVAQAIDYAARLQALTYPELEAAIRRARTERDFRLYDHMVKESGEPEPPLSEHQFIDVVSKNLRSGRCLLLIVGDGIHEEAETMAEFLQQHAGAHFALAMVTLGVYELPSTGGRLLIPSVSLQTTTIVRGIVRFQDGVPSIAAAPATPTPDRATTLSEDEFFARLDALRPGTATALRAFLAAQDDLHVEYEVRKTLIVRMIIGDLRVIPFAVYTDGVVDTGWFNPKELMRPFAESLANAIPGAIVKESDKSWYVPRRKSNGGLLTVWDILDNQAACRTALEILHQTMITSSDVRQQ